MKRLHVHVAVDALEESTKFYTTLFGQEPSVLKSDYAKWMLEDPRVNFAISKRGREAGLDHLGVQVETEEELSELTGRLKQASMSVLDEGQTTCCYAQSEKSWVMDPQGIAWETFLTTGESTIYGLENPVSSTHKSACCAPEAPVKINSKDAACCEPAESVESACCSGQGDSVSVELKRK